MDSIKTAVANGAIRFAVVIPEKAAQQLENGKQVKVQLHYDNASVTSKAKERAQKVIREFSESWRSRRLASLGLAGPSEQESLLEPVAIQESGTAEMREVLGERLGGLLPYLFIIFCFLGAMYPAIDLGAGEKERGTLETLLLAPVPRWRLVMGKFLVIFTTGVTSALLTLTSLGAWLLIKAMSITKEKAVALTAGKEILATVNLTDLLLIGLMLIPIAAMFAALLLAVSIYARSFKEASSYCGPLNFLIIVPAIIAILPGVQLTWGWAMVPVTNVSLAIKELVKGTMNYPMLIAILGSSFLTAGAMLFFCAKWFQRESVLFRE
jgi:sodium transport system permease protein